MNDYIPLKGSLSLFNKLIENINSFHPYHVIIINDSQLFFMTQSEMELSLFSTAQ